MAEPLPRCADQNRWTLSASSGFSSIHSLRRRIKGVFIRTSRLNPSGESGLPPSTTCHRKLTGVSKPATFASSTGSTLPARQVLFVSGSTILEP